MKSEGHVVAPPLSEKEFKTLVDLARRVLWTDPEQRRRLQERVDDPKKRWKWSSRDLEERKHWNDYQQAYEDALAATSTKAAPWFVIPADRNWFRDLAVSEILVETLAALDLRLPAGDPGIEGLQVT